MPALSLKTKMSLVVSLFVTVVITILALSALWYFEGELKNTISKQQFTLVSTMAEEIDSKILNAQQELIAVAELATANLAGNQRHAQNFLDTHVGMRTVFDSSIFIFSPNGRLTAVSPAEPILQGRDYSFRDYIKDTVATGKPQISRPFFSTQSHHHSIVMFTAPFFDARGKMTGILAGALDLMRDNFLGKLATVRLGDKGYLYLYSTDRTLIVHHDRTRILRRDVPPGANRLFDRAIEGFEGTGETVTSKGLHALSSFKRLKSTNWILAANFPQAEAYAPVYSAKWYLMAAAVMALILSNIMVWWFMHYLTTPLLLFTSHVKGIAGKEIEPKPIRITSNDEIGTLARAFNEMLVERKRVEEELAFKNAILFTQNETSIDGILLVDESNTIISYNRRFVELWGIPPELVEAGDDEPVLQLAAKRAADPEGFVARIKYLYEHKEEKSREEVFLKDGRVFDRYSAPMRGDDGKYYGRVSYLRDITERKRMEDALWKSESIMRKIFESIPDMLAVIDRDLRIVHSNWQGGYEYVPEDIRAGSPLCYDAYYPERGKPCDDCHALKVFRTGRPVATEKYNPRIGLVEVRAFPVFDDSGDVVMVAEYIRNITEQKRLEEELRKAHKLESLGVLAGGIAHDFNNLLTGILGNISLAKIMTDQKSKAFKRLDESEKAVWRARDLTQQLMTFSKGGAPVKKTASMEQIVKDSASFVLRGSNVRCEFTLPGHVWPVDVDEGQMNQVINNLIINADQSMVDGGIIEVGIKNLAVLPHNEMSLTEGRYVKISIMDHGVGIPEKYLQKIFDPYFTTKQKGSGLGLATVYSIIKNHDGYVGVESKSGVGTTFQLYIPASENVLPEVIVRKENPHTGSGKILVMDDEEIIREVAAEILEHLGYSVVVCSDGNEAIELYRRAIEAREPFTAVLMDLTVPGRLGGKDAAARILEIDPGAVLIVSSGYSSDPVIANFRQYGFSGMVPKPFDAKGLARELKRLVP